MQLQAWHNKLKKHEKICNDHDCHVEMPNEYNKILKYNHRENPLKVPFIIYIGLECLLEIILSCQNNLKKSCIERKAKCEPSGWAMTVKHLFDTTKTNEEKEKEMIPLTEEEIDFYEKQKVCYICKETFCADETEKSEFKLFHKVRDHCHYTGKFRGAAHSICNSYSDS